MPDPADHTFDTEIRSFLFDGIESGQQHPEFTLLADQPGGGRSRILGQLLAARRQPVVALRARDLVAFRNAQTGDDVIRGWLTRALGHARDNRISVVLEDRFDSADAAAAMLRTFAGAEFTTNLVVVATSRAESLLASVALQVRRGTRSAPGVLLRESEEGIEPIVRLHTKVADHTTTRVFDGTGLEITPSAGLDREFLETAATPPKGRAAAEWISELRRITEAVATQPDEQAQLGATLAELHRIAIRDVVPGLALPAESSVRTRIEARLRANFADLQSPRPVPAVPEPAGRGLSPS